MDFPIHNIKYPFSVVPTKDESAEIQWIITNPSILNHRLHGDNERNFIPNRWYFSAKKSTGTAGVPAIDSCIINVNNHRMPIL